jgi:hypothetical protein
MPRSRWHDGFDHGIRRKTVDTSKRCAIIVPIVAGYESADFSFLDLSRREESMSLSRNAPGYFAFDRGHAAAGIQAQMQLHAEVRSGDVFINIRQADGFAGGPICENGIYLTITQAKELEDYLHRLLSTVP